MSQVNDSEYLQSSWFSLICLHWCLHQHLLDIVDNGSPIQAGIKARWANHPLFHAMIVDFLLDHRSIHYTVRSDQKNLSMQPNLFPKSVRHEHRPQLIPFCMSEWVACHAVAKPKRKKRCCTQNTQRCFDIPLFAAIWAILLIPTPLLPIAAGSSVMYPGPKSGSPPSEPKTSPM